MTCKLSNICIYYNMHKRKPSSIKSKLLIKSYCEGPLESTCRRKLSEVEFRKIVPDNMAPNGYLLETKIYIDKFRDHRRYAVRKGTCTLKCITSGNTFHNEVIDMSAGGLKLITKANPHTFRKASNEITYKIINHTLDESPIPLTKEFVKVVWQNNQVFGCAFVSSSA